MSAVETMTAVVQDEYGTSAADVLRVEQIDRPVPGDDEVLVRVAAAGVDRGTWHLMAGLPYVGRPVFGLRRPKRRVPGLDLSGTVAAVGSEVTGLAEGDEVYGIGQGSFAQYATAEAAKVCPKPANLTFEQAAAVPVSAITALEGVRDHGEVSSGQKVLIVGASGGVGTYAVQMAKALGAEVTGVCSTGKVDLVRSLGADHVIDYTAEDFAEAGIDYDVILDIGGNRSLSHLRRALAPKGRLIIVGGEDGGTWLGGIERNLRAVLLSPFVGQKLGMFVASEGADTLQEVSALIEAGAVVPAVDRALPLTEAASAVDRVAGGRARGKVVITTTP